MCLSVSDHLLQNISHHPFQERSKGGGVRVPDSVFLRILSRTMGGGGGGGGGGMWGGGGRGGIEGVVVMGWLRGGGARGVLREGGSRGELRVRGIQGCDKGGRKPGENSGLEGARDVLRVRGSQVGGCVWELYQKLINYNDYHTFYIATIILFISSLLNKTT